MGLAKDYRVGYQAEWEGGRLRGDQTARLMRMLLMLTARRTGESVADLAGQLNVSVRTVYRDLATLQQAGVPLVSEREGENTVWRIVDAERWRMGIPLGLDELMALHVAGNALFSMGAAHWAEPLSSALETIDAAVPGRLVVRLAEMVETLSPSKRASRHYEDRPEILAAVFRALLDRRPLDVQYATPGRGTPVPRRLLPYHLRTHDQGQYLVAHDSRSRQIRTFLVDRIRLATVGHGYFERPDDFDADSFFGSAFGVHRGGKKISFRALVKPRVAHLLEERRWHPSQRLSNDPAGTIVCLDVADTPELRSWVRSFGADMIVLEPDSLGRDLVMEAERMVRDYAIRRGRQLRATPGKQAARKRTGPADEEEEREK